MATNIHNLIGAICPDIYCTSSTKEKVKQITRTSGYLEAAKSVKLKDPSYVNLDKTDWKTPFKLEGIKNPISQHKFTYDLSTEPGKILEELYFWILDFVNQEYGGSKKLVDNFIASPGSSLFTDLLTKRTRVQEEASRIMGNVNTVIRSILNIIYDLKDYDSVLELYDDYHSNDEKKRDAALISLKQRWLDQVDIKRGGSSIKQLSITGANQPNFVLLIDAFMTAKSLKVLDKLDLNDRIKRLLQQRLEEFFIWVRNSEDSLRKRYAIEKNYLKSQMNSVKLYAKWAKPYLKASKNLQEDAGEDSGLVNSFNTALFELTLLGIGNYDPIGDIGRGYLPKFLKNVPLRKYKYLTTIEMKFRSSPETVGQHHRFRGRLELVMTSYALNEEELDKFLEELDKDDVNDVLRELQGATEDSLEQIQKDVDEVLKKKSLAEKEVKPEEEDINPFFALFSFLGSAKKSIEASSKKSKEKSGPIKPDSEYEQVIRSMTLLEARRKTAKTYNTLKKAYSLPTL